MPKKTGKLYNIGHLGLPNIYTPPYILYNGKEVKLIFR